MMVEYRQGDLLNSNIEVLVNAVNRLGFMGAGIAKAFKDKYPQMFLDYKKSCLEGHYDMCFTHYYKDESGKLICNLRTVDDKLKGVYAFVEAGLLELRDFMEQNRLKSVAIPPLGCGIGGLDKEIVKDSILKIFGDSDLELYLYNF